MTRAQVLWLHVTIACTALTGAVFALMKYAMSSDDPFANANHPLQPYLLDAHVVVAPLLVFVLGWVFGDHIWPKFVRRNPAQRKSGISSMMMIVPMTLSGYLMQVVTNEPLRKAMMIAHWVSSALFVVAYVAHLIAKPRPRPS
jgi:Na+/proline symporter